MQISVPNEGCFGAAGVTAVIRIPRSAGVPAVPHSTGSSFSGDCSETLLCSPFSFWVYLGASLCGGNEGEGEKIGLGSIRLSWHFRDLKPRAKIMGIFFLFFLGKRTNINYTRQLLPFRERRSLAAFWLLATEGRKKKKNHQTASTLLRNEV